MSCTVCKQPTTSSPPPVTTTPPPSSSILDYKLVDIGIGVAFIAALAGSYLAISKRWHK